MKMKTKEDFKIIIKEYIRQCRQEARRERNGDQEAQEAQEAQEVEE